MEQDNNRTQKENRFREFERMTQEIMQHKDQIERIDFSSRLKNGTRFTFNFNQRSWERKQKPNGKLDNGSLFNGIFDIIAIGISIAILVILIIYAEGAKQTSMAVAYALFSSALIIYNLLSSLYHFFSPSASTKKVFKKLKSMFRFIVTGTAFAPVYLLHLGEAVGLLYFMILLVTGAVGIFFTYTDTASSRIVARIVGGIMPLIMFTAVSLLQSTFGNEGFILLSFSAVLYVLWGVSPLLWKKQDNTSVNFSNFFMVTGSLGFFWFFLQTLPLL